MTLPRPVPPPVTRIRSPAIRPGLYIKSSRVIMICLHFPDVGNTGRLRSPVHGSRCAPAASGHGSSLLVLAGFPPGVKSRHVARGLVGVLGGTLFQERFDALFRIGLTPAHINATG